MTKDELRTRVEAELLTGKEPIELSKTYDVSYAIILNWKKKLLAEKQPEVISELTQHTKASLEVIRQQAVEVAPKAAKAIDNIIDGINGLKELEPEFHTALQKSVKVAQKFLDDVDDDGNTTLSIKEWQLITSTLANAYSALFNRAGTTVNVAQTSVNVGEQNLAFFKASQKKL